MENIDKNKLNSLVETNDVWEKETRFDDDYIHRWVWEDIEDYNLNDDYDAFYLVVHKQDKNDYHVSIFIGGVNDLYSANYHEEFKTLDRAAQCATRFMRSFKEEIVSQ